MEKRNEVLKKGTRGRMATAKKRLHLRNEELLKKWLKEQKKK